LIADIEDDLAVSLESLPLLPTSARRAVAAAQMLFGELNLLIWDTPADELIETRISVPTSKKLFILLKAIMTGRA
jgi:phytoene/squalene synthetase